MEEMRKREEKRTRRRMRRSRVAEGDGCSLQRKEKEEEEVWELGLGFWEDFRGFEDGDGDVLGGMVDSGGMEAGDVIGFFFPVRKGVLGIFGFSCRLDGRAANATTQPSLPTIFSYNHYNPFVKLRPV